MHFLVNWLFSSVSVKWTNYSITPNKPIYLTSFTSYKTKYSICEDQLFSRKNVQNIWSISGVKITTIKFYFISFKMKGNSFLYHPHWNFKLLLHSAIAILSKRNIRVSRLDLPRSINFHIASENKNQNTISCPEFNSCQ